MGPGRNLDVFGRLDLLAVHRHPQVANEQIVVLDLSIHDRYIVAAPRPNSIDFGRNIVVRDFQRRLLDRNAIEFRQLEFGLYFDLTSEFERALIRKSHVAQGGRQIHEPFLTVALFFLVGDRHPHERVTQDLDLLLVDRGHIRIRHDLGRDLLAHLAPEPLFDEPSRRPTPAKAGNHGVGDQLLILGILLGIDALARDGNGHLLA